MTEWKIKFSQYYILTHTNGKYYQKDFINNYKYIFMVIGRLIKDRASDSELLTFMNDVLDVHKRAYEL